MGELPANVIILTPGLTGSSVVAGLLTGAGYTVGPGTVAKPDYDTFENRVLVELNDRILEHAGHGERFDRVFRADAIAAVEARTGDLAVEPFLRFIEACDREAPWLWKDPRLWLTMPVWARLVDLSRVRVIILGREPGQAWVSHILRRQIQTPGYCRAYMAGIRQSSLDFVARYRVPFIELEYEQILLEPEATVARIGAFLGVALSVDDLRRSFRGRLYRRTHGMTGYLRAVLIFVKNYRQRLRVSG